MFRVEDYDMEFTSSLSFFFFFPLVAVTWRIFMAVTCNCLGQASVSTTVAQVASEKSKIFNVQPQNFAVSWTYKKKGWDLSPLRNSFGTEPLQG